MIAFLEGRLVYKETGCAVLEVGGVGYRLLISDSTFYQLPSLEKMTRLYTRLIVKEEELQLYGFTTQEELHIFNKILNVNGVGPRGAIALLSNFDPATLQGAVTEENAAMLAKAPGIGKKTAQRIIIELKDKFEPLVSNRLDSGNDHSYSGDEAMMALVNLGYSQEEARTAVTKVTKEKGENIEVQNLIRQSLKVLGNP